MTKTVKRAKGGAIENGEEEARRAFARYDYRRKWRRLIVGAKRLKEQEGTSDGQADHR